MKEVDMVVMAAKGSAVTVNHGQATPDGRLLRTPGAPLRLTRRGRMAVTGLSALLIGALSVGLATAAQATRAGAPSPSGRYVAQVLVLPGQSLWSLAEAYDPNADPRLVIQEIQQLNSMTGDQVRSGAVLWVPRG
jgi:hypothetical protein